MSRQTTQLIETLKQHLRSQGVTYKDLAKHLSMSEANVKRMFSQNKLSLERLETICNLLHMDILQLAQNAQNQQHKRVAKTLGREGRRRLREVAHRKGFPMASKIHG